MAARISLAGPQSDVQGRMATATTGTGTLTLGAASLNATTFAGMPVPIADGDTLTYELVDIGISPPGKEKGRGTYHSAGPTLSRDTVIWSTNGNARLNLSGNAFVFVSADDSDVVLASQARTLLQAAAFFFIDPDNGNDGNSGTSSAAPWKTLAPLANKYDLGGQTVTVTATGTSPFSHQISIPTLIGGGSLILDGAGKAISVTNLDAVVSAVPNATPVTLQNWGTPASGTAGLTVNGVAGSLVAVSAPSIVKIGAGMVFGPAPYSHMAAGTSGQPGLDESFAGSPVLSAPGAGILVLQNYDIASGANCNQHFLANMGGTITCQGRRITCHGNFTVGNAFANARWASAMLLDGTVFDTTTNPTTVTGPKFICKEGAGIHTNVGGANLPGTIAGSTPNLGWID